MPVYTYQCEENKKHRFDAIQPMKDAPLPECQICHGKVHRVISSDGRFILKGNDGWTTHDNREF